jgi:hypothetical protein
VVAGLSWLPTGHENWLIAQPNTRFHLLRCAATGVLT